jgi:hypothetical protein
MTTFSDMVYIAGGIPAIASGQIPYTTGSYFFVDSGHTMASTNGPGTADSPYSTIDSAIDACTASAYDVIIVAPGHAETIAGATTLVMDRAGVQVIGLGHGALRPTLTYSATGSIINVTAADCTLQNLLIVGAVDNIVTGIAASAAADGLTLRNIEMRDGATDEEFLIAISIAALCTDVTIDGFKFRGLGGGMSECILLVGAADRFTLTNSYIHCDASAQAVDGAAAASVDVIVKDNLVINIDTGAGLGIAFHNSTTGFVSGNHVANLKDTVVGLSGTGVAYCENYASNALGASGIILPAVDV